MSEETSPLSQPEEKANKTKAKSEKPPKVKETEGTAAKAAKKAAPEDKPFSDFISQDYLPALEKALSAQNVSDLKLDFSSNQVSGKWLNGQRHFTIYFPEGDINAQRAFSCSIGNAPPSTFEPFLGDERKITLDLLVFGVIQRLNAQKWLGYN